MNRKWVCLLMVLTMAASLILSGYSINTGTRILSEAEEETEEDEFEELEEIFEEEDTVQEGEEYELNGFTFFVPAGILELEDWAQDVGYLFSSEDGGCILEILMESFDGEEMDPELIEETLESAIEAVTGEIEPAGDVRKHSFTLNGMSAVRIDYPVYDEDYEADFDLDMTLLVSETGYALVLAYTPAEDLTAEYVRFLDTVIYSIRYGEKEDGSDVPGDEEEESGKTGDEGDGVNYQAEKEITPSVNENSIYDLPDSIELLADYTFNDSYYTYHFMIVKNLSDTDVDLSATTFAYSADGDVLGYGETSSDPIGPGCISILTENYDAEGVDYYEVELKSKESRYAQSVIQNISAEEISVPDGIVLKLTNHGSVPAEYVKAYVLFFNGDELVGYDYNYFTDDDSEIKPDDSMTKQFRSYEEYDHIDYYLTGKYYD